MQKIISSQSLNSDLTTAISECEHDRIFILTDEKTAVACLPVIQCYRSLRNARNITVKQGDTHKDIEALADIWQFLSQNGATRHSLLINLGGGMITDLGGFAAATFKRGIDFINIPTTLLAMVDAILRTEERDRGILRRTLCAAQHCLPQDSRPGEPALRLC